MKFDTETEKFLYEERRRMMKELELLKPQPKEKESFSVHMISEVDNSNGGYQHPTHKATMYIKKNGLTIILDPDEIKRVVQTAGGNFKQ